MFDISVSQGAVQAETVIKEPMQTIALGNGDSIVIEKGSHDDTDGMLEYNGSNFVGKQLFVQQRQLDGTPMSELI